MQQTNKISVTCPNGHSLLAPLRAAGKMLPCPICRSVVAIEEAPREPLTEPAVLEMLNTRISKIAEAQPVPPQPKKNDTLSDTGVMRILGDCTPLPDPPKFSNEPTSRECPKCARGVSIARTVCQHCQCYLGPAPDYLREITRGA